MSLPVLIDLNPPAVKRFGKYMHKCNIKLYYTISVREKNMHILFGGDKSLRAKVTLISKGQGRQGMQVPRSGSRTGMVWVVIMMQGRQDLNTTRATIFFMRSLISMLY